MKITSVTYRSNRPTVGSKYIHQHVELTAKVGPRETAAGVLEKLRAEVHSLLYPELAGLLGPDPQHLGDGERARLRVLDLGETVECVEHALHLLFHALSLPWAGCVAIVRDIPYARY